MIAIQIGDPYALAILRGLQRKPQYEGTVPDKEIRRRRAVAKLSRKANRDRRRT